MKYVPPYGAPGADDPYINGDPSIARQGSILPAAAAENPQREIVNMIADSTFTPADADLHQLAKAVQSGQVFYGVDNGTANHLTCAVVPALTSYKAGQFLIVKIGYTNTAPSDLNAGGGVKPIIRSDGTHLLGGEMTAGGMGFFVYDGTSWQFLTSSTSSNQGPIYLSAMLDIYVDGVIGHDTTYDGSQPTISGAKGPFKTIQRGIDESEKYNLNGWNITIHVADANYPNPATGRYTNGAGIINIQGNDTTPGSCFVHTTGSPGTQSCFSFLRGNWYLSGFKVQCDTGADSLEGNGINCTVGPGTLLVGVMHYYTVRTAQISLKDGWSAYLKGAQTINSTATGMYHIYVGSGASLGSQSPYPVLTITGTSTFSSAFVFSYFAYASPRYSSYSGKAYVIGAMYAATGNGIVDSYNGGASYYPGNAAGWLSSGGQYMA